MNKYVTTYTNRVRHWTRAAKECYIRGGVCEGCYINEMYCKAGGWTCQMKTAVLATVQKLGIPEDLVKNNKENFING